MLFYHASTGVPASLPKGKTRQATKVACLEKSNIINRTELKHILISIIRRTINRSQTAGCKDIFNFEMDNIHLGRLEFITSHVYCSFIMQSKYSAYLMYTPLSLYSHISGKSTEK